MMICAVSTSTEDVMLCFHSICMFVVSRIMQNWLNQFLQNSMERWHISHPRTMWILVVVQIMIR